MQLFGTRWMLLAPRFIWPLLEFGCCKHVLLIFIEDKMPTLVSLEGLRCIMRSRFGWHTIIPSTCRFGCKYILFLCIERWLWTFVLLESPLKQESWYFIGIRMMQSSCEFGCKYILVLSIERRMPTFVSLGGLLCMMAYGFGLHQCYSINMWIWLSSHRFFWVCWQEKRIVRLYLILLL